MLDLYNTYLIFLLTSLSSCNNRELLELFKSNKPDGRDSNLGVNSSKYEKLQLAPYSQIDSKDPLVITATSTGLL